MKGNLSARLLWCIIAIVAALVSGIEAHAQSRGLGLTSDGRKLPVLHSGWYLYEPYQFIDTKRAGVLSGVDIEIAQELSKRLGFHVEYAYMDWRDQVDGVYNGSIDFCEAARTPELDKIAHFTEPYRTEEIVLLLPPDAAERFRGLDTAQIIEIFETSDMTLGVVDGFSYGENRLSNFIQRHSDSPKIVVAENSTLNIRALADGTVDAVLEDRMSAIGILWKNEMFDEVAEVRLLNHPHADIAIMFSKENFSASIIQQANAELAALKAEGFIDDTHRKYLIPLFLRQTTEAVWYSVVDFIGTVAFALSGAMLAWRLNANLAGFILLSGLPAVGGGIARDVLLGREIWALHSSYSLAIFVGVALLAYAVRRLIGKTKPGPRLHKTGAALFNFSDAAGLASFTVTGVAITVSDPISHPLAWAPFFGALTAAGGGMARDAIVGRGAGTLFSDFYVQISLLFGTLLTAYIAITPVRIEPNQFTMAVMLTMIAVVVTRLAWLSKRRRLYEI
jgi:polar amino acid transport system substrate-binding protein